MGTNYYIRKNECKSCKRYEEIHLGKSSGGWKFLIQANGFQYYKTYEELKKFIKGKVIYNEYEEMVTPMEFMKMIESKQEEHGHYNNVSPLYAGTPKYITIEGYDFFDCDFS